MPNPSSMSVATINAYGLDAEKLQAMKDFIKTDKIDILFICETWAGPDQKYNEKTIKICSPAPTLSNGRRADGVALMTDEDIKVEHVCAGLAIRFSCRGRKFAGVYLPPRLTDSECRDILNSVYSPGIVMLGDFNMRLGNLTGDIRLNERGEDLVPWFDLRNLDVINPTVVKPTFVVMRGDTLCTSIVDLVWSDYRRPGDTVEVLEEDFGSDHRMVVFRTTGDAPTTRTRSYERWRLARVKDATRMEAYKAEFAWRLEKWTAKYPPETDLLAEWQQSEIDECYKAITDTIREAAMVHIGKATIDGSHRSLPVSHERRMATRERNRAWRSFNEALHAGRSPEIVSALYDRVVLTRKEVKKIVREEKSSSFETFAENLLSLPQPDVLKIFKRMKSAKTWCASQLGSSPEELACYRNHFAKQFTRLEWQPHKDSLVVSSVKNCPFAVEPRAW